jgi:hypothetical protein
VLSSTAAATTGSVFSPDVDAGSRAVEYRAAYIPEDDDRPKSFTHRLHYQHALNEQWRWRGIVTQRSTDGERLELRYGRLELQWQYLENQDAGWDGALRFELQIAEGDDLPHRVRIAWTGKVDLSPEWQLRANVLAGREFGAGSGPGLTLETRAQASYRLTQGARIGLEMFSGLNNTSDVGSWSEQQHRLGPIVKASVGEHWSLNLSYLAGISDRASNDTFRLLITRDL